MRRVATGLAIGLLWLALLLRGNILLFWLVIVAVTGRLLYEETRMSLPDFTARDRWAIIVLGLFPVGASFFGTIESSVAAMLPAFVLLFLHLFVFYRRRHDSHRMLFRGVFAIVYFGLLLSYAPLVHRMAEGPEWLLFLTAVIVASDSGAYYGGTSFGRHKLCSAISPKKTVEGLFFGLASAVLAALLVKFLLFPDQAFIPLILAAILLALIGVIGDLLESVIKREAGVKDSGILLPGHGGLFDRLDSLVLAVPVLYYLLAFGLFS